MYIYIGGKRHIIFFNIFTGYPAKTLKEVFFESPCMYIKVKIKRLNEQINIDRYKVTAQNITESI